jgi:hypothetical protein
LKYAIVLLLLCSAACVKSKSDTCPNTPQYQVLTPAAKEWLPYSNNKSLIFENSSAELDTIELAHLFTGDDDIWVGDKCPITKGQFVRVDFFDRKTSDTIKTQVGFQDEVRIFTKLNHIIFYETRNILLEPTAYKRFEVSTIVAGKTFSSVLVLECSPTDACVPTGITKIYFAKGKGLVAYQRNGVLWTLT